LTFNKHTLFVGKVIHHFEQLPSTNAYATDFITKNKPSEGTVISASNQTAGRGQHGRIWESSANQNLTLSIILFPTFLLPKHQFWLNQAIALGVRDFIGENGNKKVWIKWPNDIYIEDKKVAGILIQNAISGSSITNSIIGIGININQSEFGFEGNQRATSLFLATQKIQNLDSLRQELFWHIETRYLQLKRNDIHKIQSDYMDVLYQYQERKEYELPTGERFIGMIEGIAPNGQLVINKDGILLKFNIKEVRFL
jgi:BirA family biotin operon repressor/biotin-[acetyl-CoA-carboxylase] ligase